MKLDALKLKLAARTVVDGPWIRAYENKLVYADPKAEKQYVDEATASATFVITTTDEDRSEDIVESSGCQTDNFKTNPTVLFNHQSEKFPIGVAEKDGKLHVYVEENRVVSTCFWHLKTRESEESYELVRLGVLRKTSIGFLPIDADDRPGKEGVHVKRWDLLEWSVCVTPCNPNCGILARKFLDHDCKSAIIRKAIEPIAEKPKAWSPGVDTREYSQWRVTIRQRLSNGSTLEGDWSVSATGAFVWEDGDSFDVDRRTRDAIIASLRRAEGDTTSGKFETGEYVYTWYADGGLKVVRKNEDEQLYPKVKYPTKEDAERQAALDECDLETYSETDTDHVFAKHKSIDVTVGLLVGKEFELSRFELSGGRLKLLDGVLQIPGALGKMILRHPEKGELVVHDKTFCWADGKMLKGWCPKCGGKGRIDGEICSKCGGLGSTPGKAFEPDEWTWRVTVWINPNTRHEEEGVFLMSTESGEWKHESGPLMKLTTNQEYIIQKKPSGGEHSGGPRGEDEAPMMWEGRKESHTAKRRAFGQTAYKEGYVAQQNGKDFRTNPHPPGTKEREDWEAGWWDAEDNKPMARSVKRRGRDGRVENVEAPTEILKYVTANPGGGSCDHAGYHYSWTGDMNMSRKRRKQEEAVEPDYENMPGSARGLLAILNTLSEHGEQTEEPRIREFMEESMADAMSLMKEVHPDIQERLEEEAMEGEDDLDLESDETKTVHTCTCGYETEDEEEAKRHKAENPDHEVGEEKRKKLKRSKFADGVNRTSPFVARVALQLKRLGRKARNIIRDSADFLAEMANDGAFNKKTRAALKFHAGKLKDIAETGEEDVGPEEDDEEDDDDMVEKLLKDVQEGQKATKQLVFKSTGHRI